MGEWREDPRLNRRVRIAPRRDDRPNDFSDATSQARCPFCAGAESDTPSEIDRIGGESGWTTRVVRNLYPAFDGDDGAHEVVIESPQHKTRFVDLSEEEGTGAVSMWARRIAHWRSDPRFDYQLVFKNEGPAAGASLAHVHSQVVALPHVPEAARRVVEPASTTSGVVVHETAEVAVFCPPAPRFVFETWITGPGDFVQADPAIVARLLQQTLRAIGAEIEKLAFNLGVHAPAGGPWRIEITPRVAAVAGFELATGQWINTVTPEDAAARLRCAIDALEAVP